LRAAPDLIFGLIGSVAFFCRLLPDHCFALSGHSDSGTPARFGQIGPFLASPSANRVKRMVLG
jgi:hypothetical protein